MCFCASGCGRQRNDSLKVRGSDLTPHLGAEGWRPATQLASPATTTWEERGGGNKGLGCRDKTK